MADTLGIRELSPLDELARILQKEYAAGADRGRWPAAPSAARASIGSPSLTDAATTEGYISTFPSPRSAATSSPRVGARASLTRWEKGLGGVADAASAALAGGSVVNVYSAIKRDMSDERKQAFNQLLTTLNTVFIDGGREVEGENIGSNIDALCTFFDGEKERVKEWQKREAKINTKEDAQRTARKDAVADEFTLRMSRASEPLLGVPRGERSGSRPSVVFVEGSPGEDGASPTVHAGRRKGTLRRLNSMSDTTPLTRQKLAYLERAGLITNQTEALFTEMLAAHVTNSSDDTKDALLRRFLPPAPPPAAEARSPRSGNPRSAATNWKVPLSAVLSQVTGGSPTMQPVSPRPGGPCPKCGHVGTGAPVSPLDKGKDPADDHTAASPSPSLSQSPQPTPPPPAASPTPPPRRRGSDLQPDFTRGAGGKRKRRLGGDLELVSEEEVLYMQSFSGFLRSFVTLDRAMWQSIRTIAMDENVAVEECGSMLVELVINDPDSSWKKLYHKLGKYKRIEQDFHEVMKRFETLKAENRRLEESNILNQAFLSGDMARQRMEEIMGLEQELTRLSHEVDDIARQNQALAEERAERYAQVQALEKQLAEGQALLKRLNMLAADTKVGLARLVTPDYADHVVPTMSEVDQLRRKIMPDSGAPTSRRCPACLMPSTLSPHCPATGHPHRGLIINNGLRDISDENVPLLEVSAPIFSLVGAIVAHTAAMYMVQRNSMLAEQGSFDDDLSYGVAKRFISILLQSLSILIKAVRSKVERPADAATMLRPSDNPLTFFNAYEDAQCVEPFPQQFHGFRLVLKQLCAYSGVNATNSAHGLRQVVVPIREERIVLIAIRAAMRLWTKVLKKKPQAKAGRRARKGNADPTSPLVRGVSGVGQLKVSSPRAIQRKSTIRVPGSTLKGSKSTVNLLPGA